MFIFEKKPNAVASEAYRALRTNIQYSSFDESLKVLVVTSSEPNEGKSTTAGNLAFSLAEDGKKVILIDCDLRKPTLHKKLKLSNNIGLSEVLVGKDQITKAIHKYKENMHVLTSGKVPPNPAEMLGSKLMTKLLDELRELYDYVVLDTSPVLAVADSQILSTKADGTILVVRSGATKKENVIHAKQSLDKVKAKIVGTVFTGVENRRSKYYHYYGASDN